MLNHSQYLSAQLSRQWSKDIHDGFAKWLAARDASNPKAPKILRSHDGFFVQLDKLFSHPEQVGSASLLDQFSVSGLRKHLLPVEYLQEALGFSISEKDKQQHVEAERISAIIDQATTDHWSDDLQRFNLWLISRDLPSRTRRLYLSSAASLIRDAGATSLAQLTSSAVSAYLAKVPGARNNLSAALRFTHEVLGHQVSSVP